ncbi:MAG: hypothetical protein ACI867_001218 [Glaciecola sp.]|jgi:hypothetical protein
MDTNTAGAPTRQLFIIGGAEDDELMSDALLSDASPRIVELLSENVASLSDSGAAF